MLMETVVRDFALYLEAERGYSPNTIKAYCYDLRGFFDFIEGEGVESSVEMVTTSLVRAWVVAMHRRGLSKSTVARRLHGLRSFWSFLLRFGHADSDPVREVSVPKCERPLPKYLPADDLQALLDASQRSPSVMCGFRNYAMMSLRACCIWATSPAASTWSARSWTSSTTTTNMTPGPTAGPTPVSPERSDCTSLSKTRH